MKLIVGTRGSALALAQTDSIISLVLDKFPDLEIEKKIIKTKGDKILDKSLDKIGDKGLFVSEIERELLEGTIDFAVHSLKDMPTKISPGLKLAQTPERQDPRDVLVINPKHQLRPEDIMDWLRSSQGLKIGTGSKRRTSQLKRINESIQPMMIRGNIGTRLEKLVSQDLDAIVLAAAGINRLGMDGLNLYHFSYEEMIPACGQGALAIEVRSNDENTDRIFDFLADDQACMEIEAERTFLEVINGGCHVPVGATVKKVGDKWVLMGMYGREDCSSIVYGQLDFEPSLGGAKKAGQDLASYLIKSLEDRDK
ncbi:hydroxymethylbilane synthase [Peptostreptococcus stomatis]|uniref:hydroxymethylbilane synthase n=1 Tax=Peptostreptococcus stomatis TaxID=341694 RepID=UPI0028DBEE12|nr:hydroxymethylbilane synthase [Peptostreptococcus stomatis]